MKLLETLQTLKKLKDSKVITNQGQITGVNKVENGWQIITISTDRQTHATRLDNKQLISWVNALQYDATILVDDAHNSRVPALIAQEQEALKPISTLTQTLLASIDRVKNDPEYINQAKAISNTANTLINLTAEHIKILNSIR